MGGGGGGGEVPHSGGEELDTPVRGGGEGRT